MLKSRWSISCLLLTALCCAKPAFAKEKMRIHVVQSMTYLHLVSGTRTMPSSPEQSTTTCRGTSGIYVPNYGSTCVTTTTPAMPERTISWPSEFGFFHALSVIMPNGDHLLLICGVSENHCGPFQNKDALGIDEDCHDEPHAPLETSFICDYRKHGASEIGVFDGQVDGDLVTISSPNGKRVYRKAGVWGDQPKVQVPATPTDRHQTDSPSTMPDKVFKDANSGDRDAQSYLGYAYSTGNGVPKDMALALSWTRKAADQGDPFAENNLALFYAQGEGVPMDTGQAVFWWRKAADQNNPSAQCGLGAAYEFGIGVPQSFVEAYFWLDIGSAALSGPDQDKCLDGRDAVAAKLTASDLSAAQKRATQWFADHLSH